MLPHVLDEDVHSNERKLFGEKITNEDLDELFENDDFWNQFN